MTSAIADNALSIFSQVTRSLPNFKGLGFLCRNFNDAVLRTGANPFATAPMKHGHKMLVDLRSRTELYAYYKGTYDDNIIDCITSLLDPNLIFLDVGANVGFYSISVADWIRAKKGAGQVLAFEPLPSNHRRLVENVQLNDLSRFVQPHDVGLSDHAGEATISLREDFQHGSGTGNAAILTNPEFDAGFECVSIKLDRLDDLWARRDAAGRIDVVKIDIEGHEDFCLQGGKATVAAHRPVVIFEVNKPYYRARNVRLDDLFRPALPQDYSMFRIIGRSYAAIASLDECLELDNVIIVPNERLALPAYSAFRR